MKSLITDVSIDVSLEVILLNDIIKTTYNYCNYSTANASLFRVQFTHIICNVTITCYWISKVCNRCLQFNHYKGIKMVK